MKVMERIVPRYVFPTRAEESKTTSSMSPEVTVYDTI
jgi:hypothetical protein